MDDGARAMTPELTRREFLAGGAAAVAGLGLRGYRSSDGFQGTLHVLGIGAGEFDEIARLAKRDLGFDIAFDITGTDALVQRAITTPASFDVLANYYFTYDLIWRYDALQPIDTRRITRWSQVDKLFKYGKVRPGNPRCTYGQGDAPFRRMYVDDSGAYPPSHGLLPGVTGMVQWIDEQTGKPYHGLPEPRHVVAVPNYFNMDSIGYNSRVIDRPPERVSWAELLNSRWKGRVALFGGAQIGLVDAGNAAEAAGLMRFRDKGDMSRAEIDRLVKILVRLKKSGQFHGLWDEGNSIRAVEYMLSKEVVVESMWSTQVTALQAEGFPVRYAAPPEGYRGWAGGFAISSAVEDPARLQAAYDYVNWWHSGPPGALTMRVGYYNPVQKTTRPLVSPAEWDYWIAGKPAARDLPGAFGDVTIRKGQVRDGGPYSRRACRYACWNSVFREHAYQERRWHAFQTA
jgi:putative spermidine/putrescine transport system substrate-binding protein